MKPIRKGTLTLAALLGGVCVSSATVTVQGWWRMGETGSYYADSSPNNRPFQHSFSCAGSGNAGGVITPNGCGGPLGTTGATSSSSVYWTLLNCGAAGMWNPGNATDPYQGSTEHIYNPPPTNYVIECWILPDANPGSGKFFMSGSTYFNQPPRPSAPGGVYFSRNAGTMQVGAFVLANADQGVPADVQIGDFADMDPTRWMHVAIVNDNGTNTFYVNGVAHGAPQPTNTIPNGNIYAGSGEDTGGAWHGYLDEFRISTFAPGAFSTSDLLLRPPASIIVQPQPATVWDGGAAVYSLTTAYDTSLTYQWQRTGSGNIVGATTSELYLPTVTIAADNGASFSCVVKSGTSSTTSSNASLTVVPVKTVDVDFYRQAVNSESTLIAYFPADGDTGTTLSNTKDGAHNGKLEGNASYDGRTNRAFGVRSLRLTGNGDVTIANPVNSAYEFPSGNGTIEAITFLDPPYGVGNQSLFAVTYGYGTTYYGIQITPDGTSIIYTNDALASPLIWSIPASILGRQAHVAVVFDHTTNVTAYADGVSLGTKQQPGFGSASGAPAYLGASAPLGSPDAGVWNGTIDELAIYSSALPANTIAIHNSKFVNGTNVFAPSVTSQPLTGSRTLLAGGSPTFTVGAAGTAPLSYQWYSGTTPIPGATSATLTIPATTTNSSGDYHVTVSNPIGSTDSQTFTLNFIPPPDAYAIKVMNDNPSAYWRLDETDGTNSFDQAGGHDGTYRADGYSYTLGVPSLIPTVSDPAASFNSGSSFRNGGKVLVPFNPVFNSGGPFTIEAWCQPNFVGNGGIGFVVSSELVASGVAKGWFLCAAYNNVNWDFMLANGSTEHAATGGPEVFVGQLHHVVGVYDGTNAALYVDGTLGATMNNPLFVPNPSAPLQIAVWNASRGYGFNGPIDEVAFYGYALSANQISNHYSIRFQPSAITTQPVGVTNAEWSTITLTAVASGFPNTYQWYKGSTALADAQNADGSAHYQGGVTNASLVIAEAHPSDSGQYHIMAINSLGNSTSDNANVLITPDQTVPTVVSVIGLPTANAAGSSPYLVKALFSKRISESGGAFTIPGATVNGYQVPGYVNAAPVGGDWKEAILKVTGLTPGQTYTVTISGVKDQAQAPNALVTTNLTFKAPPLTQGTVAWDYYYLGSVPNGVDSLISDQYYPNAPQTNWASTSFDSTPITTGDYNNVPGIGAAGDNYGASLSGWITPTVTTNYYFFLASDDNSRLLLNPAGSDPAGAFQIANLDGARGSFVEPGVDTSTYGPVPLTAGQRYYIQALHIEGGGGDYVKVAWRMDGDTNAAANLTPIPGTYLSSYAVPPVPPAFNPVVFSNGQLSISWTGAGTLLSSPDVTLPLSQWTTVTTTSPYVVTPATGAPRMFYRVKQ